MLLEFLGLMVEVQGLEGEAKSRWLALHYCKTLGVSGRQIRARSE
jgi:hypothetical protein